MAIEKEVCSNCANFKICKYMEGYEQLSQQACHLDVTEPFKVKIICPYFSKFMWGTSPGIVYRGQTLAEQEDRITPPGACCKE